jgi:molybdopterin synthase catalytic subunit
VTITVLLFARAREAAGTGRLELEVAEASSPSSVFEEISRETPALTRMRPNLRCAIDQEYAAWDTALHDGAELAFISPTAGG